MSPDERTELDALRREIAGLREGLAKKDEEVRRLDTALSDVNTKLIAGLSENFDGSVYRKAMEHDFKDHVYKKIRNVFGAVSVLAAVGGAVFVQTSLKNMVESTIEEKEEDFVEAGKNLNLERLGAILREIRDGRVERITEVRNEKLFEPLLVELLEDRDVSARDRRERAIHYAGLSGDRALIQPIAGILESREDVEIRVQALNTLLSYLPDEELEETIEEALSSAGRGEGEALFGEFTRSMSLRSFNLARTDSVVSGLMRTALESPRAETFRAAVLFFLVNPDLWSVDADTRLAENISGLKKSEYFTEVLDRVPEGPNGGESGAKAAWDFLERRRTSAESRSDQVARGQIESMQQYLALARLEDGDKELMARVLDGGRLPYFPEHVWDRVGPSFVGLPADDLDETGFGEEPVALAIADSLRRAQDRFWSRLDDFDWDDLSNVYAYTDPEEATIRELRAGDLGGFLEVMSTGYYERARWLSDVYPLFPGWEAAGGGEPTGTESEQDDLWRWVEDRYPTWDPARREYVAAGSREDRSIEQLRAGDLEGFLEIMRSSYYDESLWLAEVLPLFPEWRELRGGVPTGTNQEQDDLWRWVEETTPAWNGAEYRSGGPGG